MKVQSLFMNKDDHRSNEQFQNSNDFDSELKTNFEIILTIFLSTLIHQDWKILELKNRYTRTYRRMIQKYLEEETRWIGFQKERNI